MPALSCRKSISCTVLIGTRVVPFMMDSRGIPWEKKRKWRRRSLLFLFNETYPVRFRETKNRSFLGSSGKFCKASVIVPSTNAREIS